MFFAQKQFYVPCWLGGVKVKKEREKKNGIMFKKEWKLFEKRMGFLSKKNGVVSKLKLQSIENSTNSRSPIIRKTKHSECQRALRQLSFMVKHLAMDGQERTEDLRMGMKASRFLYSKISGEKNKSMQRMLWRYGDQDFWQIVRMDKHAFLFNWSCCCKSIQYSPTTPAIHKLRRGSRYTSLFSVKGHTLTATRLEFVLVQLESPTEPFVSTQEEFSRPYWLWRTMRSGGRRLTRRGRCLCTWPDSMGFLEQLAF